MVRCLKAVLLLMLVAALLPGCAGMDKRERISKLEKTLQDYAAALRWARYSDAYDFIRTRDGSRPALDMEGFDGYRVARMDIIRSDLNEEETEAKTYVVVKYYKDTSGTIQEYKEVQDWWYHEETKRWFLEGDLPYPEK